MIFEKKVLTKPRIEFIDLVKGICCILVVFEHCHVVSSNAFGMECLRMPLYLFISGLFFRNTNGFLFMVRKKFNQLIVPMFFFYAYALLVVFCFDMFLGYRIGNFEFSDFGLFCGLTLPNVPLWFLRCLFVLCILSYFITKYLQSVAIQLSAVLILGGIGHLLASRQIVLPFSVASAFTSIPFFWAGFMCRQSPLLYPHKYDKYALPVGLLLLVSGVLFYEYVGRPRITIWSNSCSGYWYFAYLTSAILVPGFLLLCKAVGKLPLLTYLGRNSLIVYGVHWIIIQALNPFVSPIENFAITCALSIAAVPVCKKFFPYFTAQQELIPPLGIAEKFRKKIWRRVAG